MTAAIHKMVGNFTEADIDDEIILMRLDNGELLSLVDTAAVTWRLIDGSRDPKALVAELVEVYAGDSAQIADDVDDLLGQLRDARLIAGF
jgi:hypothetical protein